VVSCTLVPWARAAAQQQQPPQIPALSTASAENYTRQVLRAQFGSTLSSPSADGAISECASADRTHVLCAVRWRWSKYNFQGAVGIWYGLKAGRADWFFAYVIKRTDSECLAANQATPSVCAKTFKAGVLAFGASAATRTAPPWAWSQSYAEQRLARIHFSCTQAYGYAATECSPSGVASQDLQYCETLTDPARAVACLQAAGAAAAAAAPAAGFMVYSAACTGVGPVVRGYHFRAFTCTLVLTDSYRSTYRSLRIYVRVVGRTAFRWQIV
jgi:hypothetical protein